MNLTQQNTSSEKAIRALVRSNVVTFAQTFSERHISEYNNPEGTLNMKIHNVFIAVLGEEIQYYTALVRSFDSTLGNMLENLAINIASLFYKVEKQVTGPLYPEQIAKIAELLEAYKNRAKNLKPDIKHYKLIQGLGISNEGTEKTHVSDYYLTNVETNERFLIELKIGGDLDNKKARSEKEALMEQYAILSNKLGENTKIKCFFATAYNRYGEGKPWQQGRVRQFFSDQELLIGQDFWNFVCKSPDGYRIVIDEYKNNAYLITEALNKIKETYL